MGEPAVWQRGPLYAHGYAAQAAIAGVPLTPAARGQGGAGAAEVSKHRRLGGQGGGAYAVKASRQEWMGGQGIGTSAAEVLGGSNR